MQLRQRYLLGQLRSMKVLVDMLEGKKLRFDEEALALHDAVPPAYPEDHYRRLLEDLDAILPGSGGLTERYEQFRNEFVIPWKRLNTVCSLAVEEGRERTKARISLSPLRRHSRSSMPKTGRGPDTTGIRGVIAA